METETQYISAALIAIIVPMVLGWLLRSASFVTRKSEGVSWLYYGNKIKGISVFFTTIVVGLIILLFNVEPKDKMPVLGMIGLFGSLTLPLVLESYFVRIGYDSEKIYCYSIWRPNRVIFWSEVDSAIFSESMRWWVIETKSSGKIRVSELLSGMGEFLVELEKRGVKTA